MEKRNRFCSFTKIWFLLYLIVALAFTSFVIYMDVLPDKYVIAFIAALAVVTLILMLPMWFRKFRNRTRIPAFLLSVILMAGFGFGAYHIAGTLEFMETITTVKEVHTEDYYVVAEKSSLYDESSIRGKEVAAYITMDQRYIEAKNTLEKDMQTTFVILDDIGTLSEKLMDKSNDLIFLSKANYEGICEQSASFKNGTKIVYTVKLPVENKNTTKAVDVTKEPFNVYVSGLDVEGTIDVVSRSDVNMIITVNPVSHEILLTSIPRDYYVQLPDKGYAYDKLTHTGLYGISETIDTIENLTGLEINYYVKVNYTTVTQLVDTIGGITVDSDFEFSTHGMRDSFYFYEGENYLDGARALAFARERKSFSDGDFQRNKNQQKVLKGILNKALSSETILLSYSDILEGIGDYIEINMKPSDMQALVKMQLDEMPKWNISQQSIKGTGGSDACYSLGGIYASVVYADDESVQHAVDGIIATIMGENIDDIQDAESDNAGSDDDAADESEDAQTEETDTDDAETE